VKIRVKSLDQIFLLLFLSFFIILNSLYIKSPVIGIPVSLAFFFVASIAVSDVFFSREKRFFKITLGLATFIALVALFGGVLIVFAVFSELSSLVMITTIGLAFGVLSFSRSFHHVEGVREQVHDLESGEREKHDIMSLYFAVGAFVFFVVIGFYALVTARTGEGGASVWLTVPNYFLLSFFLASFFLTFILFFTHANLGLKLSLIFVYSFLARSLFWIVWYPGRYGDPWVHLGESRYIDRTGMPYAYSWMLQNFLIVDLMESRAQYALVVLLRRMFNIDIYWVHILLVPVLWSFLVPLFSYKFSEMLIKKGGEKFPLIAALATSLVPSLVSWGTVSVPNSVGFIFFFITVFLLFYWMHTGERQIWVLSLLTAMATFVAHLQPGIFAFVFLWVVTAYQKISRAVLKIISCLLLFTSYPLALYLTNAYFALDQLFTVESFEGLQSDIVTVVLLLGLLGVMFSVRSWFVDRRRALLVFVFYVVIIVEYYLSMYGMLGLPFGPHRILVMADFLLLPFVAWGVIEVVNVLVTVFSYAKMNSSVLKKVAVGFSPKVVSLALVCLVLSVQATITLNQVYPRQEIVELQPAIYEMDAIYYINSTAPGPYVVLCDTQLANLAIGLLGADYGYAGGRYGLWGQPFFTYPTIEMYGKMIKNPSISISIMKKALAREDFEWAEIAYFVVSMKSGPNFRTIWHETSAILPVDAVFGNKTADEDGKLYVFKYPPPVNEELGPPVKVKFDEGGLTEYVNTTLSYIFETEINSTLILSEHTSYNITEYPKHWVFLALDINNASSQFDEASDINWFVYVKGLEPDDVLTIKWQFNRDYPSALWKEDSFKNGWRTHDLYLGTVVPTIVTDGNILNMSYSFASGPYSYYYYVKPVGTTITGNQFIMVRWRSDGPIAVLAYYYELGLSSGVNIVPVSSESGDWTVTVVKLREDLRVTYVMVGISNLGAQDLSGVRTLSVDYILISTST